MVVNVAQLTTYSQAKQLLLGTCKLSLLLLLLLLLLLFVFIAYFVDDIKCHFVSSMISGLVTTIASMPVDISKTRYSPYSPYYYCPLNIIL